ncbi:accessory Sec system protein Asp2 [Staphylococcus sp. HKU1]|uniref:accessory Sec system protein Asp2 n=1 Tax=Staphylococcus sp. HKU1 TaxID=3068989 RepID=UPI003AAFE242
MKRKFKALQIGGADLETYFENEKGVIWDYFDVSLFNFDSGYIEAIEDVIEERGKFDFVFVQAPFSQQLIEVFEIISTPYNTYIDQNFWSEAFQQSDIVRSQMIRPLIYDSQEKMIEKLQAVSYSGQYGDKLYPMHCVVHPQFTGDVTFNGNKYIVLDGDFGQMKSPVISWKNSIVCDKNKGTQIWPEFKTEGDVEIEFTFRLIKSGTVDTFEETYVLKQDELEQPFEILRKPYDVYASVSLKARGNGKVSIGAIHKRWSRKDMGQFLFGGQRYTDNSREEFFYYFNPGDMKPPLNVYFSGYRSLEGFEAYFLMKGFDAPFLLISDPRIEGGAFYLGSESYEQAIQDVITDKLNYLNFKDDELILSGLSMGSFGALYYGAQMNPSGVIIGKPLINVGTIADNMRLLRPEDFGTSLDVLMVNEQDNSARAISNLNNRFWNVLKQSDVSNITFGIAYMEHDDYDATAFPDLLPHLTQQQARVMSRGIPGRHNDDSPTIVNWFLNFYRIILETKFGRVKNESE